MILLLLSHHTTYAQVPFEFEAQETANAEEVNANFTTLVNQINQIQARLFALETYAGEPTTSTLAGSYKLIQFTMDIEPAEGSVNVFNSSSKSDLGTVTLNNDGTGLVSQSSSNRQLQFFTQEKFVRNSADNGTENVLSTGVDYLSNPDSENFSITWTHSNGVITITEDDEDLISLNVAGRILISGIQDFEGQNGIMILVRE
jgi:hypothetical protein